MTEKQITRPDPYLAISELHILSFEIRCARRTLYSGEKVGAGKRNQACGLYFMNKLICLTEQWMKRVNSIVSIFSINTAAPLETTGPNQREPPSFDLALRAQGPALLPGKNISHATWH
jgi:hypothetical protein